MTLDPADDKLRQQSKHKVCEGYRKTVQQKMHETLLHEALLHDVPCVALLLEGQGLYADALESGKPLH